jgi:hypothetical protein
MSAVNTEGISVHPTGPAFGHHGHVTAVPAEGFWQGFGAALACYLAPAAIRSIRAGRPEFIAVIVVLAVLFCGWASRFPRTASVTFAYVALVGVIVTLFAPSSEPVALHLSLVSLGLTASYLGFRAHWEVR